MVFRFFWSDAAGHGSVLQGENLFVLDFLLVAGGFVDVFEFFFLVASFWGGCVLQAWFV